MSKLKKVKNKVNIKEVNNVVKKRILRYSSILFAFFAIQITCFLIIFFLSSHNNSLVYLTLMIIFNFLLLTFMAVIFDFVPAKKLRKQKYVNKHIKDPEKGYKFFLIMVRTGVFRFLVNLVPIIIMVIGALLIISI